MFSKTRDRNLSREVVEADRHKLRAETTKNETTQCKETLLL